MKTKTITTNLTTAAVAIGATLLISTSKPVEIGESRVTTQTEQSAVVVTKTSEANREIKVLKKQFDKQTGQELAPLVFTYNSDSIKLDIKGKQDDIVKIQAEIKRVQGLMSSATGSGDIVITTKQFSPETGEELSPLVETYKVEEAEKQIEGGQEAVTAITAQIAELNALLAESNKLK